MSAPYSFDEFFASGKEESISPFLTPNSRNWGKNISLKAAILAAFLLAIAFGFSFFNANASFLVLSSVYFIVGTPALIGSLEDLKNLEINIDVLMTLAALLSILIGSELEGALLLVLFALSAAMENSVNRKTKTALIHLQKLSPKMAWFIEKDGSIIQKSIREIGVGSSILIKAGEIIPLDGLVSQGSSFINLSHLTGESEPMQKIVGSEVAAGALNLDGTLNVTVTRTSTDSTLSRIIKLITQAQMAKPPIERFLDRFGKWYASSIILLALSFALLLPFFFAMAYVGENGSIYRALTFLIAASPCALIIATPTAYLSALSSCAKKGIILKGGVILDALDRCSIIAFDKTGTLTTGKLEFVKVDPLFEGMEKLPENLIIQMAASLEKHAVHPIGSAIEAEAKKRGLSTIEISHFHAKSGFGIEALISIQGEKVAAVIGHPGYIEQKIPIKQMEKWHQVKKKIFQIEQLNTLFLIKDSLYAFHFQDEIRKESIDLFQNLKKKNELHLIMLTGDHSEHARIVADSLGIHEIYTDLRPENKLDKIAELSQKGDLIMVGDGINDAPALARSNVGVSMGKIGSATAVDASDVVFLQDDLSLLDWLIDKAKKTTQIVRQNLTLALCVIFFATTPALLGLVPLWVAVLLHEGGTVLVGLNSLRLLKS